VEELGEGLGAVRLVGADGHGDDDLRIELGDELGRPRRRERATDGDAGDVDRADVAELFLGHEVTDVAEVDRVETVELDDERRAAASTSAPLVIAIRPDPGE